MSRVLALGCLKAPAAAAEPIPASLESRGVSLPC